jgi:hypothetical protein
LTAGLGDEQLVGDLLGRGGRDEGVLLQGRPAQRGEHLDLPAGELGGRHAAQLDRVGGGRVVDQPAGAHPGRPERQDVALLEQAAAHRAPVDAGAVGRQAQVADVEVGAASHDLGVQPADGGVVDGDVDAVAPADRGHHVAQREALAGLLPAEVGGVHVRESSVRGSGSDRSAGALRGGPARCHVGLPVLRGRTHALTCGTSLPRVARRGQDDDSALSALARELPLLAVLAVVTAGLVLGVLSRWRVGAVVLGGAVLLAGLLRLVLPARRAGLLVVRTRRLDVAVLLVLGVGLVALATSVPAPVMLPEPG